jgi:hypothetical protein
MIYFVTQNNYLKCHHITDGHTDGRSPSAFHREFENNYLKCHHITNGRSPSAFHREFEHNYLKCHHITDGHTDEYIAVGTLSILPTEFLIDRANIKGLCIKCISDRVRLPTDLPTDCEKYGGPLKKLVQNSKFTDGFLTPHRRNKLK